MFGDPLTAGPAVTAPGPPITFGNVAAAGGSTGFLDVSVFEGIVVSCNTGIGAGNAVTFTLTWYDQQQGNVMSAGGFFPTSLTVAGGAGSLNGVRIRNFGPFLKIDWNASAGPAPFLAVWGSNHQFTHDGPACGSMDGAELFVSGTLNNAISVSFGGSGATIQQQYCGPALLNFRSHQAQAGAFAGVDLTDATGRVLATACSHDLQFASEPQRVWVPPIPFLLTSFQGGGTVQHEFALVAGW